MADARESFRRLVRWIMRDVITYYRVSLATVVVQTGSTVDLTPDDPDLAGLGLQGVPLTWGLPDSTAQLVPGCKVLLFFEQGDPRKPRAVGFDGTALMIQLGGGTKPVARVGDPVAITSAVANPGGLTVTGTAVIVGGSAKVQA